MFLTPIPSDTHENFITFDKQSMINSFKILQNMGAIITKYCSYLRNIIIGEKIPTKNYKKGGWGGEFHAEFVNYSCMDIRGIKLPG